MEKIYKLELTLEETIMVSLGIGLLHKESAKAFYETLEGLHDDDPNDVEKFDKQHKTIMGLYKKIDAILSEEEEAWKRKYL
jgi:hypothetical protein